MNSNVDYRNYFVDVLNGAVLSKLSLFTQEKIDELKNPKSAEIENLNNLTTVNAKLLYIKHSGLFEVLSKIHNSIDVRIAKSISYISGEKVSTIKGLIPNLKKGYSSQVTKNTPYTNEAIRQATKCLLEAGLNTNGLEEILFEIERKDQDK